MLRSVPPADQARVSTGASSRSRPITRKASPVANALHHEAPGGRARPRTGSRRTHRRRGRRCRRGPAPSLRSSPAAAAGSDTPLDQTNADEHGGRAEGAAIRPDAALADGDHGVEGRDAAVTVRAVLLTSRPRVRRVCRTAARRPGEQPPRIDRREEHPTPVHLGERPALTQAQREAAGAGRAVDAPAPGCATAAAKLVGDDASPAGVMNAAATPVTNRARISTHPVREPADTRERRGTRSARAGTPGAGRRGRHSDRRAA